MTNHFKLISKVFLRALLISIFAWMSCTPKLNNSYAAHDHYRINYELPQVQLDGTLKVIRDSFYMAFCGEFIICRSPVKVYHENDTAIVDSSIRYECFVYKKGMDRGKFFDSIGDPSFLSCSVDSLLRKKALGGLQVFDPGNMKLVTSQIDKNTGGKKKVYLPLIIPNEFYGDTCVLFTKPSRSVHEYELSPHYDRVNKDKVWKAEIRFRRLFSEQYKVTLPARKFLFEVNADSTFDIHDIMKLIHMYEYDEDINLRPIY